MMDNMRVSREKMIASIIAGRYSLDDQIAILRQKDTKPEEYEEFFAFAEQVKASVTAEYEAYEAEESAEEEDE